MAHGHFGHARGRHLFFGLVLLALCGAALGACVPRLQLPGPGTIAPHVTGDVIVASDGANLPLRTWAPDGPPKMVVLALHGFNDYSNAFEDAGEIWAKHGVITYAYDQRGFGGAPNRGYWAGIEAYADDLRTAARLLRQKHPGLPFYILGESMGGAVVMVTMARDDAPQADGVILVAPAVWGRDFMPVYQTIPLWFSSHLFPWVRLTGEGLSIRPSDNIEMLRKFAADPMVIKETRIDAIYGLVNLMDAAQRAAPDFTARSLILYGMHDEIVPEDPVFAMIDHLPKFDPPRHTVAVYRNGYHMLMRDLEGEVVIKDVLAWIEHPGRPLPSGADRRGGQPTKEAIPAATETEKQHAPGLLPGVERP